MRAKRSLQELLTKAQSVRVDLSRPFIHPIELALGSENRGKRQYVNEIVEYLQRAGSAPSAEVDMVLVLCFIDGLDPVYALPVCRLLEIPSQYENEDVIDMLDEIGTTVCVNDIYLAAMRIPSYDDARSYAKKCIRALVRIGGENALEKLRLLSNHEDAIIRDQALSALRFEKNRT